MVNVSDLRAFLDTPIDVEAVLSGLDLRVDELLSLEPGRVITTTLPAGANVDVTAGDVVIAKGELTLSGGRLAVRMLNFREKK